MNVVAIASARTVAQCTDLELADTHISTPDGHVPTGVAGYVVGECTVLCPDCGREHPDVHEHEDLIELHEYDYRYLDVASETDYLGHTCEECDRLLDTNILIYEQNVPHLPEELREELELTEEA